MARPSDRTVLREPEPARVPPGLSPVDLPDRRLVHDDRLSGTLLTGGDGSGLLARGVTVEESRGEQLDLTSARLPGLALHDVELRGGSLANADLRAGSWRRVAVSRARLTGVRWTEAVLDDVTFRDCQIDLAAFSGAELRRVTFHDCRLSGSDLQELSAQDVSFVDCDLSDCDITGARFLRTEMHGCTLDALRPIQQLRGVQMRWEDILAAAGAFAGALGIELTGS